MTTSFGVLYYGFGAFLPSMERSLGWSKLTLTGAYSLALLVSGFTGIVVGKHLDRHSPRLAMAAGSLLGVAGVLAWSSVQTPLALYASWAVIGVAMGATLYDPSFVVVTRWFHGRGRTRALTVVTLFAGLASTIFIPLEVHLVHSLGWRPALRVLALVLLCIPFPLHLLVLTSPPEPPAEVGAVRSSSLGEALQDARFWYLLGATFLIGITFSALNAHQLAFLQERGWKSASAAAAVSVTGLWQLGARVIFAPLARVVAPRVLTVLVYASQVLALVVLAMSTGPLMVALFVACTGVARGMYTLVRATLVGDLFGTASYGAIGARVGLSSLVAQSIGPILGSALRSGPGGYTTMLCVLAGLASGATVLASRIQRVPAPQVARTEALSSP